MNDVVHAYVDGELDLIRSLEVEKHLEECSTCSNAVGSVQSLRSRFSSADLYHRAPSGLRERIQSLSSAGFVRPRTQLHLRRWFAIAASIAFAVLATWGAVRVALLPSAQDLLAQEVVSSHVRSLLAETHLMDVASTDRHTVKPWFSGKVDFAPPVEDFAQEGFPLAGGRLDYVDGRNVAALVYRRNKHVINLFIWPADTEQSQSPKALTRQGYHLIHWSKSGLTYWAISDLNEQELQEFANIFASLQS
jgi:anti-sigma factor RsiW